MTRRRGAGLGSIAEDAPQPQQLSEALLNQLSRGIVALKIGSSGDWESNSVSDTFCELRGVYNGKKVPLRVINSKLQMLHEDMGISMTKIKKVIRHKGICLHNCKEHKCPAALRAALHVHADWIIPREKAKEYKYCKMCLIQL